MLLIVSSVVAIVTIALAIMTSSQSFRIRPRLDAARLCISTACALVLTNVVGIDVPLAVVAGGILAGALLGWVQAQGVDLDQRDGVWWAKRSTWGLVFWGLGLLVTQVAAFANRAGIVRFGLAVTWFSVAAAAAFVLGRRARQQKLEPPSSPSPVGVAAATVLFLVVAVTFSAGQADSVGAQDGGSSSLGTGAIQVTLSWNGDNDMDLHVVDTGGFDVHWTQTQAPSGGFLDRDDVPHCEEGAQFVENVFWSRGTAPPGDYVAFVQNFRACPDRPAQSFILEVRIDGELVARDSGTLGQGQRSRAVEFTVDVIEEVTTLEDLSGGENLDTSPTDVTGDGSQVTEVDEDGNVVGLSGDDDITDEEAEDTATTSLLGGLAGLGMTFMEGLRGLAGGGGGGPSIRPTSTTADAGSGRSRSNGTGPEPEVESPEDADDQPTGEVSLAGLDPNLLAGGPNAQPFTEFVEGQSCPFPIGAPNHWVNTATLNLVVSDTVFAFSTPSRRVDLTMTHNSSLVANGDRSTMFGPGWFFRYEAYLAHAVAGAVDVHLGDGSSMRLWLSDDGVARGRGETTAVARITDAGCTLRLGGDVWTFDAIAEGGGLRQIERAGDALVVERDEAGHLRRLSDAAGRTVTFEFADGRCVAMQMPGGRRAAFTYEHGRLTRVTDAAGIVTAYTYLDDGRLSGLAVGATKRHGFGYIGASAMVQSDQAADGTTTYYRHDDDGVHVIGSDGTECTYRHHEGRTVAMTSSDGRHLERTFATDGRLLSETVGAETTGYRYEGASLVEVSSSRNTWTFHDTVTEGVRAVRVADAEGPIAEQRVTTSETGTMVRRETVLAMGSATVEEFDAFGRVTRRTRDGEVTDIEHDRFGNIVGTTVDGTPSSRVEYDAAGIDVVGVSDALGRRTELTFDLNRRLTSVTAPSGRTETMAYSACGLATHTDSAGNAHRFDLDAYLAVAAITDPDGERWLLERRGADTTARRPDGTSTRLHVDPANPETRIHVGDETLVLRETTDETSMWEEGPDGGRAHGRRWRHRAVDERYFSYETDALDRTTTTELDQRGRPRRVTAPDGSWVAHEFDLDDREIARRSSDGMVTTFDRDRRGRVVSAMRRTAADATSVDFGYDGVHLTHVRRDGQLVTTDRYDVAGQLITRRYGSGVELTYAYGADGEPTSITIGGSGPAGPVAGLIELRYDRAGHVVERRCGHHLVSRYERDPSGRLTSIEHVLRDGGNELRVARLTYDRSPTGSITGWVHEIDGVAPSRPRRASVELNPAGEITAVDAHPARSDGRGMLAEVEDTVDISYSADGHTTTLRTIAPGEEFAMTVDPFGDRRRVTHNGRTTDEWRDQHARLLYRSGAETVSHVFLDRTPHASVQSDGSVVYRCFDALGNTVATVTGSGEIVGAWDYDADGRLLGSRNDQRDEFGFGGGVRCAASDRRLGPHGCAVLLGHGRPLRATRPVGCRWWAGCVRVRRGEPSGLRRPERPQPV